MRRWIMFGVAALMLGAAAWYFGKPTKAPAPASQPLVEVAQVQSPKEPPPKVIEVIDLARAYEPVPELEEVQPWGVDPVSFIPVTTAPERIPYAASDERHWFGDFLAAIRRTPLGAALFGTTSAGLERIDVMPREVRISAGAEDVGFWGFGTGQLQDLLFIEEHRAPARLDVMPREVSPWEVRWPPCSGCGWFIPFFHGGLGFVQRPEPQGQIAIRGCFGAFVVTPRWVTRDEPIPVRLAFLPREVK